MNVPRVSVLTPTYNRRRFIPQLLRCFQQQTYPKDRLELVVIDDGSDPVEDLCAGLPAVRYVRLPSRAPLGHKRNLAARVAAGDILVHMDDDDYYPERRVESAVQALLRSGRHLAGSSILYTYFVESGDIVKLGPYGDNHSTAGAMAYDREYLRDHRFDEAAEVAEERAFTRSFSEPVAQIDPRDTLLCIAHGENTVDKRPFGARRSGKATDLTLDDFLKSDADREFYATLRARKGIEETSAPRKRVLYIGNFVPPHSTENHLRASLHALGVKVFAVQENATSIRWLDEAVRGADLLLYTRTWGLSGGDALAWIKSLRIPSASYHLDLYAGLARGEGLGADPFWSTRYVFTADGGSDDFFRARGINHHYVKPGVHGAECYRAEPVDWLRADVGFVGSYDYHPEWPYRRELVDFLRRSYGRRFVKYGSPEKQIRGHAVNQLYASVKVLVGDSLCLGFDHPHYWSDRIYETLGRGGFMIHPYIRGLEEELEDRKHVVYYPFGDFDELRRLCDYYVAHDDEREAIRSAGHEHVKANCTYVHRMRQMLGILGQHEPTLAGWT